MFEALAPLLAVAVLFFLSGFVMGRVSRLAQPVQPVRFAAAAAPARGEYEFREFTSRLGVDASDERARLAGEGWELLNILPSTNGLVTHVLRRRVG